MKYNFSSYLRNLGLFCLLMFIGIPFLAAQQLDFETRTTLLLDDGTEVILFGQAVSHDKKENAPAKGDRYYYLPPANSLRLSTDDTGDKPAFFLLKYAGNTNNDDMGGAIYFNMEFGLTKEKESEVEEKLRAKLRRPNAQVMGAVQLLPEVGQTTGTFNVMMLENEQEKTIQRSSAPIGQGGKLAILGNLDRTTTEIYEEVLSDKNMGGGGIFVDLRYSYPIMVRSFTASLKFNSTRFHEVKDSITESYSRTKHGIWGRIFKGSKEKVTKEQFREFYEELRESNVITHESEAGIYSDPETTKELEQAFFDYFFTTFTQPAGLESAQSGDSTGREINAPRLSLRNQSYTVSITEKAITKMERNNSVDFKHRTPYRFTHAFSNDIRAMLRGIDLKKHIKTILLDDPFFAHRQINLSLDANLSSQLGEVVSSVEIRLRKKKTDGDYYYFGDQAPVIFNETNKALQVRMYNRINDERTDDYEYMVSIIYNGGRTEVIDWRRGPMDQLVISSKLKRKEIEFLADATELKENRIMRASLQIQYSQLGQKRTQKIDLSPNQNEESETSAIFIDAGAKRYATRFIMYHKEHGKVVTDWEEADIDDNFFMASIPDALRE